MLNLHNLTEEVANTQTERAGRMGQLTLPTRSTNASFIKLTTQNGVKPEDVYQVGIHSHILVLLEWGDWKIGLGRGGLCSRQEGVSSPRTCTRWEGVGRLQFVGVGSPLRLRGMGQRGGAGVKPEGVYQVGGG